MCSEGKEDMSSYKEGQIHQLAQALEAASFTPNDVTILGQLDINHGLKKLKAYLRGEADIVMKKVEKKIISILAFVNTVSFSAVVGKKTAKCFTGRIFGYRDGEIDNRLSKNQSGQTEGKFSVQQLTKNGTFKQAVESFLRVSGKIDFLAKTLKERNHTTCLPTIESLIERQELGEDVDLLTNGWGNFFFIEDKDGSVAVVYVRSVGGRRWDVEISELGHDGEWLGLHHFFFRN